MPGPVSDSYDPEFGTGQNAADVAAAINRIIERLGETLGPDLKNILDVVHGPRGDSLTMLLSEQERRVIRFALRRALESI